MACFLVSAAEAAVVTAVEKKVENDSDEQEHNEQKITLSTKLKWLKMMLWGGAVLLMFEHVWHGEVVPWFPFLTAMYDPADMMEMLHEMATVGVAMALLVTAVWFVICKVADAIIARDESAVKA
ncbi:MAG: hypothetical protein IJ225_07995 [Solobacterium sp.]|nr:hypothetical protein [Solobacterium sp.]